MEQENGPSLAQKLRKQKKPKRAAKIDKKLNKLLRLRKREIGRIVSWLVNSPLPTLR